jgi:two-component system chemotaxis response regulator CheY
MTDVERAATPSRRRILVVDDSALVRLYYRDTLERAGFEVEQAINGIEAMEKGAGAALRPRDRRRQHAEDGWLFISSHAQAQRCGCRDAARTGDHDRSRRTGSPTLPEPPARISTLVKPVSQQDLVRHAAALSGAPT